MHPDLAAAIAPKSDQLNADDLIPGPREIVITGVRVKPKGNEQPISIHYEGDQGKPWKPCKSMARLLVILWGPDSSAYAGRRLRLYRDPSVRFGSDAVGGIRVSHMSHIDREQSVPLTVTRGRRAPYTVKHLRETSAAVSPAADQASPGEPPPAQAPGRPLDPAHPRRLDVAADASVPEWKAAGTALRLAICRALEEHSLGIAVTWWELNQAQFEAVSPDLARWIAGAVPGEEHAA